MTFKIGNTWWNHSLYFFKWPWVRQILRNTLKGKAWRYQGINANCTTPSSLQYKRNNHDLIMINRYGILVTHYHGYNTFVVFLIRPYPHTWLITGFWQESCWSIFSSVCYALQIVVCFFFLLIIVLSILFRFTNYVYRFDIFKLLLKILKE
jgi:hypothetical protein